jgi:hypothetical protein
VLFREIFTRDDLPLIWIVVAIVDVIVVLPREVGGDVGGMDGWLSELGELSCPLTLRAP